MKGLLRFGIVGGGAAAVLLGLLSAAPVAAQERHSVMVTNLVPEGRARDGFGKDLAKELRGLINEFITHKAIEEREIRDAAKQYKLEMKDLDCITSLQMLIQRVARIAFCGSYTEDRDAKTVSVKGARFIAPGTAPLEIPDRTWRKDAYRSAAQEIATSFERFVTQMRNAQFCGEYYEMGSMEDAESRCVVALNIAPDDAQVRLVYAQILRQTDRSKQAFEEVKKVLEISPANETALHLAGFLAAQMDMPEVAGDYLRQLLQLDPGNIPVRLNIAYTLARDGEPEVAMNLAQEGLDLEPDNVELLLQHASYAIKSGQDRRVEGQPLTMEAASYYRAGLDSYRKAYAQLGAEMKDLHLLQMISGLNAVGQPEEALAVTERALDTHGENPRLWSMKGDILRGLGRLDEALAALDGVISLDPNYPNVMARQGKWLLEDGREEEALAILVEAVRRGEQPAGTIANMFFGKALGKGIKVEPKKPLYAIRLIEMAKTFEDEISPGLLGQLDYFLGYSMYLVAEREQKPESLASAQLTLPKFREVERLLRLSHVADYGRTQPVHYQQLTDGTDQYIAIQEALIRRGS